MRTMLPLFFHLKASIPDSFVPRPRAFKLLAMYLAICDATGKHELAHDSRSQRHPPWAVAGNLPLVGIAMSPIAKTSGIGLLESSKTVKRPSTLMLRSP